MELYCQVMHCQTEVYKVVMVNLYSYIILYIYDLNRMRNPISLTK